jgi:hypothetical protein
LVTQLTNKNLVFYLDDLISGWGWGERKKMCLVFPQK